MTENTNVNETQTRTPGRRDVYTVLVVQADFTAEGLGPAQPDETLIVRRDTLGELSKRFGVDVFSVTNEHGGTANPKLPSRDLDAIRLALSEAREFFAPRPPRLTDEMVAAQWCLEQLATIRERVDRAISSTRAAFASRRRPAEDDTPLGAAWEAASDIVAPAIDYADMLGDLVLGGPDDSGDQEYANAARVTK